MRIALIGYMGSGKSTVGRLLSEQLNIPFIDLDERIESQTGMTITEIFQRQGEASFRELEKDTLTEILKSQSLFVLATGGGTPCFFNQIDLLNEYCETIYLRCSVEVIQMRLNEPQTSRPLLPRLTDNLADHMKTRESTYSQARHIVNGELPQWELSEYIRTLVN
jgi:shikimate kinase